MNRPVYIPNGPNLNRLGTREPAIYGTTSLALLDALKMFPGPILEVHLSNIHKREPLYHRSLVSLAATAVIVGLGADGYPVAVGALVKLLERASSSPRQDPAAPPKGPLDGIAPHASMFSEIGQTIGRGR